MVVVYDVGGFIEFSDQKMTDGAQKGAVRQGCYIFRSKKVASERLFVKMTVD